MVGFSQNKNINLEGEDKINERLIESEFNHSNDNSSFNLDNTNCNINSNYRNINFQNPNLKINQTKTDTLVPNRENNDCNIKGLNKEGNCEQDKNLGDTFNDKDYELMNKSNSFLDISCDSRAPKTIKFRTIILKISGIAFPAMLFYLLVILMETINLIFIGIKYKNNKDMAESISAANLYINCTLFAITMGLISGMDSLCSNAFALKKYYLMGLYYHRARIVTYGVTFLIVIIHIFTAKYVLHLFKLSDKVISDAIKYLYYMLVYSFFDVQSTVNLRLMNVLRKAHISFYILLICILLHPLWNYIFIIYLDWEIVGSAIAFCIGRSILCILSTLYLWFFHPIPEANFSINRKCFTGLFDFLKFSSGSLLLMCAEWWPYEILTYMASLMTEIEYNVHIFSAQINSLIFSLPIGISFATTIYISDYIVKCEVKLVKKAAIYITIFAACCSLIVSITLFFLKSQILKIYTQNTEILYEGKGVILYLCFTQFFDMIQYTFSSILRGLGKQTQASLMTFIQFYFVMMTLAWFFGFYLNMGVYGIWRAILIGNSSVGLLYFLMLVCISWEKIKEETIKRLENDQKNSLTNEGN